MAIVGSATVTIRAITSKIESDIKAGLRNARAGVKTEGEAFGEQFGKSFQKGFKSTLKDLDLKGAKTAINKQGRELGGTFGDAFNKGFARTGKDLKVGASKGGLSTQGKEHGATFGNAFNKGFKAEFGKLDLSQGQKAGLGRAGDEMGANAAESFNRGFRRGIKDMSILSALPHLLREAKSMGTLSGETYAVAFNRAARGKVDISSLLNKGLGDARKAGKDAGIGFSDAFKNGTRSLRDSPLHELATTGQLVGGAMFQALAAVSALAGGLVAVAGAAAQASGALVVLPGILGAVIQGAGTFAIAMKGVSDAVSAGNKALSGTGAETARSINAAAKAIVSAQRTVRDAVQAVTKAQTEAKRSARDYAERISEAVAHVAEVAAQGAADIVRSNEDITKAQDDVTKAVANATRVQENGLQRVAAAEDRLARSQKAERDAQVALTQARKDAEEQLQQLAFSLEDAVLAEQRSELNLEDAQARLAEVQDLPPDNKLRREAELAFKEAELNLREAKDRAADLTTENEAAAAAGVEGSQQVVSAQERVNDTTQDTIDAQTELEQTRADAAQNNLDATQASIDAQKELDDAIAEGGRIQAQVDADNANAERALKILRRDAKEAAIDSANAIRDAQERLKDATSDLADAQKRLNDEQNGGSTAATAYQTALNNLSPQAQTFVKQLVGMRDQFHALRDAAGEDLFPRLGKALDEVSKNFFPVLEGVLRSTGDELGKIAGKVADFISSPFFTGAFKTIADGNNTLLDHLADAGINLAKAFTRIMIAAQPLIDRFGTWIEDVTGRIDKFFKTAGKSGDLEDFFKRAGDAAATFGGLFKNIGGLFTDIFSAGADSGLGLIDSLSKSIEDIRGSLDKSNLKKYFEQVADNARSIGTLVRDIAGIFLGIGADKGVATFADTLDKELVPNIKTIVTQAQKAGPAFADFLVAVSDLVAKFAEAGSLNTFVKTLTTLVDIAGTVVTVMGPALPILLAFGGVFKAISLFGKFTGLTGFLEAVMKFGPVAKIIDKIAYELKFLALVVQEAVVGAMTSLATALGIGLAPLILIIVGVVALAAAFVILYKKSETFRNLIGSIGDALLAFVKLINDYVIQPIVSAFQFLYDVLLGNSIIPDIINGIIEWFTSLLKPITDAVGAVWSAITGAIQSVLDWVSDHWPLILGILTGPIGLAVLAISKHWDDITGFFTDAYHWVVNVFTDNWDEVQHILTQPLVDAKDALVAVFKWFYGPDSYFNKAYNWVIGVFKGEWAVIEAIFTDPLGIAKTAIDNLLNGPLGIVTLFTNFVTGMESIWGGLKGIFARPINFVIETVYNDGLRKFWNGIADKVPGLASLPEIPKIPGYARGGVVPGYRPGRDTVPAMLSPGEGILRPEVVKALGKDTILRWNRQAMGGRGGLPPMDPFGRRHYFQGGVVAPPSSGAKGGFGWPWEEFKDALKTLDPHNIADGLSHLKDVVVGALAESLRVLVLKPLRAATGTFADNHPALGAFATVPGGMLESIVDKMIDFLDDKDKAAVKEQMATGGILGSSGIGKWQFPLPQGTYRWGVGYGGYPGHTGQDLPAPRGTQIVSVGAGRVATSADLHGSSPYNNYGYYSYGRYVKVEHPGNVFSLYGHMLRRIAQVGQIVAKGQVIGLVDSTGYSSGDHLHFEIRPNDVPSPAVAAFLRAADPTGANPNEHLAQAGGAGARVSAIVAARVAARRYGWSGEEFDALKALTGGDFSTFAMASGRTSGGLEASLDYIKRRFGTPSKALASFLGSGKVFHTGGWVKGVGDQAAVVQGGEYVFSRSQAARMRQGAVVMPTGNGDLRVVAELGTAGTQPAHGTTDAETLATLKRLVTALENGEAIGKIDVHPSPGMDERELANKVGREITWRLTPR